MSALLTEASVLDFLVYADIAEELHSGRRLEYMDVEYVDVGRRFARAVHLHWPPRWEEANEFFLAHQDQVLALLELVQRRSQPERNPA